MRHIVLALVFLASCSCQDTSLIGALDPKCNTACYDGPKLYAGVGICLYGKYDCGDAENPHDPVCVGWAGPDQIQCNGLDNDCDGHLDTFSTVCYSACGVGISKCVDGIQGACSAPEPKPEVCNGLDDDCDGVIDNQDKLPLEFCYSGSRQDLLSGQCHAGIYMCLNGTKYCVGEVLPSVEVCGDGIDNDCDGKIDEQSDDEKLDVAFIFDNSCSMSYYPDISAAIQGTLSKHLNDVSYMYAAIGAPAPNAMSTDVTLINDFADAKTLISIAAKQGTSGFANEPTMDAIWDTLDVSNVLGLSWRLGSHKVLIVFSDEDPQTYSTARVITYADVKDAINNSGADVYIFTSNVYVPLWKQITIGTTAQLLDVAMSAYQMQQALDKTLISRNNCQ